MQKIDKVSYAVAGGLVLIVLIVPLLSRGEAITKTRQLGEVIGAVEDKRNKQNFDGTGNGIRLAKTLTKQLTAAPGAASAAWASERRPIVAKVTEVGVKESAYHFPGYIQEIALKRDSEKGVPYLEVKGAMNPKNQAVAISRVRLSRKVLEKDGTEGALEEIRGFLAKGDFTYKDMDVEPDKKYTYSFTSTAAAADPEKRALDSGEAEKTSAELGTSIGIPHNYRFSISIIRDDASGNPTVRAVVTYYDYEKGEVVPSKRTVTFKEMDRFGPVVEAKGKKGPRYIVRRISVEKQTVEIRDVLRIGWRDTVTKKGGKEYQIADWDPILGILPGTKPAAEPGEEDDGLGGPEEDLSAEPGLEGPAESTPKKPAAPTKKPAKRRGF